MQNLFNKLSVKIVYDKKNILWLGCLGSIKYSFNGYDLVFLKTNNKLFFLSKISYKNFLSIFKNNYLGVTNGYYVEINFIGLGSRFLRLKNFLLLKLGYSHYIKFLVSKSILTVGYKRTLILYGVDLQEVNLIAQNLRVYKKPDIYKGKGVQLEGEVINYKVGKQK